MSDALSVLGRLDALVNDKVATLGALLRSEVLEKDRLTTNAIDEVNEARLRHLKSLVHNEDRRIATTMMTAIGNVMKRRLASLKEEILAEVRTMLTAQHQALLAELLPHVLQLSKGAADKPPRKLAITHSDGTTSTIRELPTDGDSDDVLDE